MIKKQGFPACIISGAIGKKIIKQYPEGTVISRYPDMTRIIASDRQRECRNLFKAVAFAKAINNDPEKKEAYQRKIKKGNSVFRSAIKEYMANQRAVLKDE
jgi:hypothetical protein